MSTSTMTIRLDDLMKRKLDKLAQSTHRTKSYLAAEAIGEYINLHEWQIEEIHQGISDANLGNFVDHDELTKRWEKARANSLDGKSK